MSQQAWRWERPSRTRLQVAAAGGVVALLSLWIAATGPTPEAAPETALALAEPEADAAPVLGTRPVARPTPQRLAALREATIISQALRYLRKRYVEPDRVDPPRMLEAALQAVAHALDEVLVEVTERDAEGRPTQVVVRVGEAVQTLDAAAVGDLHRLDWTLHRVVRFLADQVPAQALAGHVEYVAINGLLDTLDPYSKMLDPDAWQEMRTHTGGQFGGLGIRILTRDGVLTVVGIIAGSPAERAGMRSGDRILRIDGEDTLNMDIEDAVDRLRGKVGTGVRLKVSRKGWAAPKVVRVVRAVIRLKSVEGHLLPGDIAYARIKGFQRGTSKELARLLQGLAPPGDLRGLVLDLRSNPGGLLDEAVKVCDLLVDGGPVVITVAGARREREVRAAKAAATRTELPVAVLVNRRSASASEIVAGALKESNRAVLLGERTWGKGTVQVPFEIGEGALKLTVAKYLVPGDVSIQDVGVTPDIALSFVEARKRRVRLFAPRSHGTRRKPWARKKDTEAAERKPVHRLRLLLPVPGGKGETTAQFRDQEPIRRAAALLRTAGDAHAASTLARARDWLSSLNQSDAAALARRLEPMDWGTGPQPPKVRLGLAIEAGPGELEVEAGATATLVVEVRNRGQAPLHRVHIYTRCGSPALDGVEQLVGRLDPGQVRRVKLRLRPSRRHRDLRVPLTVVAGLDGKPIGVERSVPVRVRARPRPAFAWRVSLIEDLPDDGLLSPGEKARVQVEVQNVGKGEARRVVATLRSLAGRLLHLDKGRVRLGKLAPGQRAKAEFVVHGVRGRGSRRSGLLAARLEVSDEHLGTARRERVVLPWRGLAATGEAVAKVRAAAKAHVGVWRRAPRITLAEPPPAPAAAPCRVRVQGKVRFESVAPGRRSVIVSVAGVKKAWIPAQDSAVVDLPLSLDTGLNRITILARAGRDQTSRRDVLVHCGPRAQGAP